MECTLCTHNTKSVKSTSGTSIRSCGVSMVPTVVGASIISVSRQYDRWLQRSAQTHDYSDAYTNFSTGDISTRCCSIHRRHTIAPLPPHHGCCHHYIYCREFVHQGGSLLLQSSLHTGEGMFQFNPPEWCQIILFLLPDDSRDTVFPQARVGSRQETTAAAGAGTGMRRISW